MTKKTIKTLNNFYLTTVVTTAMAGQFTLLEQAFLSYVIHFKL